MARRAFIALLARTAAALSLTPHAAHATHAAQAAAAVPHVAPTQELQMIEHAMPLMPPHLYEQKLQTAFAERGEVIRWYIARIDESEGSAIAEVVILPHAD